MITAEQFEILCLDEVRRAIEANLDRDPVAVALDKRIAHAAEVATQVKYLQRARRKLPSWYGARCIIPPLAFEQSSGEACAMRKPLSGGSVLDVTCGLGVDAFALSKRFGRVVTLERDEVLAEVARENFRRLGADNIEVVCASAEEFCAANDELFDWCFADPDRRGADGSKKVLVEDCSPDMSRLIPLLAARGTARRFCVKLSPMFDVAEAQRLFGQFGPCSIEVVSQGGECKEVLAVVDADREPAITAVALGRGEFSATPSSADTATTALAEEFRPESFGWLVVPDVALQKARLVRRALGGSCFVAGENGFAFAAERPSDELLGRIFAIESIGRYDPRALRREAKGRRIELLLRDVPLTAAQILKAAGAREGGDIRLAVTSVAGEIWAIRLK